MRTLSIIFLLSMSSTSYAGFICEKFGMFCEKECDLSASGHSEQVLESKQVSIIHKKKDRLYSGGLNSPMHDRLHANELLKSPEKYLGPVSEGEEYRNCITKRLLRGLGLYELDISVVELTCTKVRLDKKNSKLCDNKDPDVIIDEKTIHSGSRHYITKPKAVNVGNVPGAGATSK